MDAKKSTGFKLSVATLAIMNVTAVVSLRGLPAEAVYGPSSAFYYLFAAIVFLIPTSLVAGRLAARVGPPAQKPTERARAFWPSGCNGSNRRSGTPRC